MSKRNVARRWHRENKVWLRLPSFDVDRDRQRFKFNKGRARVNEGSQ